MEKQTDENEGIKRNLQCIIQELQGEMTLQKQVKMLSKETEVHCQAQMQATEAFQTLKEFCHHIQTQLQHQDQEFKVLIAVKDHR
ncbi:coiled-coil domain-containing protein 57 [Pleuronectes platessa]|uniref:coiled-coil domain-containing protein 57 n=1 Tax=Pleuronectes platessa TaxID=8262 RepID=UPI00232A0B1B|nr:coiled-coil domain-containing protein 57 [Pleuronectes platessa]XP_053270382.1 coiled-coil domain-containing protein 57 [Pleuronectes platessa]XP_053270383.1 coiled-coil domain-containing protein 57 [Pleuronectes platessa]XP_053270384.1 coiled-coil domain-containing protein 57 [Pleuronectes platessa]